MKILGLQSWASHEPAAAILSDDGDGSELVSALATEERLLRCKNSYQFPAHALVDCMDRLGIEAIYRHRSQRKQEHYTTEMLAFFRKHWKRKILPNIFIIFNNVCFLCLF